MPAFLTRPDGMHTILLIEDDEGMRSVIRRLLTREGYRVLEAEDGRAGLNTLESESVDLVITDIIMPEVEGVELILRLRRTHPHLPIIAMSGGGRLTPDSYLEIALTSGATRALSKPFDMSTLKSMIEELLGPATA